MKKLLLLTSLATLSALSGCATTSLKADDCPSVDWKQAGIQDGRQGRYAFEFARYQKRCGQTLPNRQLWEEGRQEGLKGYCTKSNAYHLGQHGFTLNAVCPEEGLEEIHNAHALGFSQYYQRQRLSQFYLPYYDYPYYPFSLFP